MMQCIQIGEGDPRSLIFGWERGERSQGREGDGGRREEREANSTLLPFFMLHASMEGGRRDE